MHPSALAVSLRPEPFGSDGPRWVVAQAEAELVTAPRRPGRQRVAETTGEVRRLWVDPGWRGRGVGRDLMTNLEEAARVLTLVELRLATGDRQSEAVSLYEDMGWERVYVTPDGAPLEAGWIRFRKVVG